MGGYGEQERAGKGAGVEGEGSLANFGYSHDGMALLVMLHLRRTAYDRKAGKATAKAVS